MIRKIYTLLLLFFVIACRPESTYDFKGHPFDKQVIDKIPVYDSLVSVVIRNFPAIQPSIKENLSYKYILYDDSADIHQKFLPADAAKVIGYFKQLGNNFIYGFEVYKDSSVKIFVRDSYIKSHRLAVTDMLSYFPVKAVKKEREYHFKDTILNKHWLYWIIFDE